MTKELKKLIDENLLISKIYEIMPDGNNNPDHTSDVTTTYYVGGDGYLTHSTIPSRPNANRGNISGTELALDNYYFVDLDEALEFSLAYANYLKKVKKTSKRDIKAVEKLLAEKNALENFLFGRRTGQFLGEPGDAGLLKSKEQILKQRPRFKITDYIAKNDIPTLVIELKQDLEKIRIKQNKQHAKQRRKKEIKNKIDDIVIAITEPAVVFVNKVKAKVQHKKEKKEKSIEK